MKHLRKSEIISTLQENTACLPDPFCGDRMQYFLRVTDDGVLCNNVTGGDYTYTAFRDVSDHAGEDSMDGIYETETMDDTTFASMIDDLIEDIRAEGVFEVIED